MIRAINVSKRFKLRGSKSNFFLNFFHRKKYIWGVKNINVTFLKNERAAIIGHNGSGKSTFLSVLSGILVPERGRVISNLKITPVMQLGVGFRLNLTARENIYLYGAIMGLEKKYIKQVIPKIISFSGLKDFIDVKLSNFSDGMRMRLAFSIAIFSKSDALLLDEVFSVGDEKFNEKCIDYFRKVRDKLVILVSHDLDLVEKYFDRCIVFSNGEVVFDGKPVEAIKIYRKLL